MNLLKTPLHAWHIEHGAKMAPFCGWEMPIRYQSLIEEHLAVRKNVGLFDVCHMGRVIVEGKDAEAYLDYLSTAKVKGKKEGTCVYTLFSTEEGTGTVDDLLIYRENANRFFLVVNASRREQDLKHLIDHKGSRDLTITPRYEEDGIIAVQGPLSRHLLEKIFKKVSDLKFFHLVEESYQGHPICISRTGYTGEIGFECIAPNAVVEPLWLELMELGKEYQVQPIGLGARNTLRLEKGFALYGQELSESIAPSESVASWAINWGKESFLGKEGMLENQKIGRNTYPLIMDGKEIPREGYTVLDQGEPVGVITSGTRSPSSERGIALALLNRSYEKGAKLSVEVRKNLASASVSSLPFS